MRVSGTTHSAGEDSENPTWPVGAHNSVVGADQGLLAPSWDQESVRDSVHEGSASARIAAGQRPRPSFRHPQGDRRECCALRNSAHDHRKAKAQTRLRSDSRDGEAL